MVMRGFMLVCDLSSLLDRLLSSPVPQAASLLEMTVSCFLCVATVTCPSTGAWNA